MGLMDWGLKAVQFLLSQGFKGIEIGFHQGYIQPYPLNTQDIKHLKSLLSDSKVHLSFHAPWDGLQYYPDQDWEESLTHFKHCYEVASYLNADWIVLHYSEEYKKRWQEVIDLAFSYNLKVAIEGKDIGYPVVWDVGHANIQGSLDKDIESFADKIVEVHLHDNHGKQDEHLSIGDGQIDFLKVISKLKQADFNGLLMIEGGSPEPSSGYIKAKGRLEAILHSLNIPFD